MERSNCCNSPIYMDVLDTGDRLDKSICVKMVYKCSQCKEITGVVSWADAGVGAEHKE